MSALYAESGPNTGNGTRILAEALAAAAAGRAVFPLSMKYPAIAKRNGGRGHLDATTQPQRVTTMFNSVAWKVTGYAVATGKRSRVIVADIDGKVGIENAHRLGLRSDHVVRSGRPDSWHLYYENPEDVEIPTFVLDEGIHIRGEGAYVCGAGSLHPSGNTYRVARDGKPSPLPECILEAAAKIQAGERSKTGAPKGVVSVDPNGPDIPEYTRNDTITSIAGLLHDGTRDEAALAADLWAINVARCKPRPLSRGEVEKIAKSIIKRRPCKPRSRRRASAAVLRAADYLRAKAGDRAVKGMSGGTGWSCYHAGVDALEEYGREHERGVTLRLDLRSWAHRAGSSRSAVSRFVHRSPLVSVIKPALGRRPAVILFAVPRNILEGAEVGQKHPHRCKASEQSDRSVPPTHLRQTLRRLRWGRGRIGKTRAAILEKLLGVEEASRPEIAVALGRSSRSLGRPLRWLVDAGLIIRPRRGYYALPEDIESRVADARELGEEHRSDRLQLAANHRERRAYREELDRREREKRVRQEHSPDGVPGRPQEELQGEKTVSEASRGAVNLSHRKREEHLRHKQAQSQQPEAPEAEEENCPIRAYFARPPDWLARQVRVCRANPNVLGCTASTVAYKVFGDHRRSPEVLPILEEIVAS